jgi:hypothetical protein
MSIIDIINYNDNRPKYIQQITNRIINYFGERYYMDYGIYICRTETYLLYKTQINLVVNIITNYSKNKNEAIRISNDLKYFLIYSKLIPLNWVTHITSIFYFRNCKLITFIIYELNRYNNIKQGIIVTNPVIDAGCIFFE